MRRSRRPVAFLCVAIVALSPFLPGFSGFDYALFEPGWVLLPDATVVVFFAPATERGEQPLPLLAPALPRGPPAHA